MRSALVSAVVAASLVVVPTAAIAAKSTEASALSLRNTVPANTRASAKAEDPNALGGSVIIIALAVAAVAIGLYFLLDDDEDSVSP